MLLANFNLANTCTPLRTIMRTIMRTITRINLAILKKIRQFAKVSGYKILHFYKNMSRLYITQ